MVMVAYDQIIFVVLVPSLLPLNTPLPARAKYAISKWFSPSQSYYNTLFSIHLISTMQYFYKYFMEKTTKEKNHYSPNMHSGSLKLRMNRRTVSPIRVKTMKMFLCSSNSKKKYLT